MQRKIIYRDKYLSNLLYDKGEQKVNYIPVLLG